MKPPQESLSDSSKTVIQATPHFQVRKPRIKVPERASGKAGHSSQVSSLGSGVGGGGGGGGGLPDSTASLRLTIRRKKQLHSAQARSVRPILPPRRLCQNMRQDPASSHSLKTYSGLVFTILRRDVTRNRGAHSLLEEPRCLLRGSLHPRPQALETLSSGL